MASNKAAQFGMQTFDLLACNWHAFCILNSMPIWRFIKNFEFYNYTPSVLLYKKLCMPIWWKIGMHYNKSRFRNGHVQHVLHHKISNIITLIPKVCCHFLKRPQTQIISGISKNANMSMVSKSPTKLTENSKIKWLINSVLENHEPTFSWFTII
jgi:hypothetical protein